MHLSTKHNPARILVIDDNAAIHADFRKILCPVTSDTDLMDAETRLFGSSSRKQVSRPSPFQIDSAFQGQEGLVMLERAVSQSAPYAMAFVDVRMPPGWDGIETVRHLWNRCPDLQVVICTAYSDHSWEEIALSLGCPENFVILKKPFDTLEVMQLAHALTKKWAVTQQANLRMAELKDLVAQRTAALSAANEELRSQIRRREQIQMELCGSEHRFALAFKASAIPMAIVHAASCMYLEVNESFTRLAAWSHDDIVGKTPAELGLLARPEDCEQAVKLLRKQGRVRDFSWRIQPKTGEIRDTLVSLEPVVLGEETCLLVAMQDVTEQKKLEIQLRQSQKMDAIGQLAAGVAHDFNNLLTIIHGHASLQLARAGNDPKEMHSLAQIKMASDRAASLTRQLLAFSRKQVIQPHPLSLSDSLQRLQSMLKRLLGETIHLDCTWADQLPLVFADESSIDQVIMNLVVNARDAMPQGGQVQIHTGLEVIDQADLARHQEARAGRFVRMSVIDNGCGMDTSVVSRIFEPFFTTKAPGKGTGLGLSTVYGIVKQHDGWVEVESAPGLGTKIHVYLPVTEKACPQTNDTTLFTVESKTEHKETVLVVEDEVVLRDFMVTVLQEQGYVVLQAVDGPEALEISESTLAKIDLLLTDMVMPRGVSGVQLAAQIKTKRQDIKVLFTSGYSQELLELSDDLVVDSSFLPKPFDVNKLLRSVRTSLIDSKQPAPRNGELAAIES